MRQFCMSGSMSGEWKRRPRCAGKTAEYCVSESHHPNHRATPRLYWHDSEVASHGSTMGYASGPFRTEEPAKPDTEGVALSAHGGTMGRDAMTMEVLLLPVKLN